MKLLDIMTAPWMIGKERLREIREVYRTHLKGDFIDVKAIESKLAIAIEEPQERGQYDIVNGVAVIPIMDVLSKELSLFSFLFGGTSTRDIAMMFRTALANDEVESILLNVDSPGGTVDGTQELAELIYSSRGQKPIVAYTDGMIASAAYYIAAAADTIYISGDMAEIGSIGVVTTHLDYSKSDEMLGYKETDIYAGKYKRIATGNRPLSDEGAAYLQDQVDYIYSIFVNDVAKYRGTTTDDVLENMADGKIFIGKQALTAGLVDGVSTFDGLVNTTLPELQRDAQAHAELEKLNMEVRNGLKRI